MLRRLLDKLLARPTVPKAAVPSEPPDYTGDREANRVDRLSPEDRAWEAASRQRNLDNEAAQKPR